MLRLLVTATLMAITTLTLTGCDDKVSADVAKVTIGGKAFTLELALTNDKRFRGLSERTFIEPDGGMLFVFPASQIQVHGFVMRDCPIGIHIIYLDSAGRILATSAMPPEPPRDPAAGEGTPADARNMAFKKYDDRLKQYSSRFPSQFVVELAAGSLKKLNLKEGQLIEFDTKALASMAK